MIHLGQQHAILRSAAERYALFNSDDAREAWVIGVMNVLEVRNDPLLRASEASFHEFARLVAEA